MSPDKHQPVDCPACGGKGVERLPACVTWRDPGPCPTCHGQTTVHPYKAQLYMTGKLGEHEAGRMQQQEATHL